MLLIELDGIIVDYGASSRTAAAQAAGTYLRDFCAIDNGDRLVSQAIMDTLKRSGGFESDDDMVYTFVYFLLNTLPRMLRPPSPYKPIKRAAQITKTFRQKDIRFHMLSGHSERPLNPFLARINQLGGGKEGTRRLFGDGVIEKYLLHSGEIGATEREEALADDATSEAKQHARALTEDLISRLYQEHYHGDEAFTAKWGVAPLSPRGEGLVTHETLLQDRAGLEEMAALSRAVLIVNQPIAQITATLKRLGVDALFPVIVSLSTLEKTPPKKMDFLGRSPDNQSLNNTWMLKQILERGAAEHGIPLTQKDTIFVSSQADWLRIANPIGIKTIGLVRERTERKRLKEGGAAAVIGKLQTLVKMLKHNA